MYRRGLREENVCFNSPGGTSRRIETMALALPLPIEVTRSSAIFRDHETRCQVYDLDVGSSVAAIQVVQVVRCTRAHDPWGPTSEDQIAFF